MYCGMTETPYISSIEADQLFNECHRASPQNILEKLAFVAAWSTSGRHAALFEYDTDLNHALYLLGQAFEKMEQRDEAAKFYRLAIEAWPIDEDAYVAYSNTEVNRDNQIEVLERGLILFDDPRVRFNLAHAYLDVGKESDALRHLRFIDKSWSHFDAVARDMERAKKLIKSKKKY
jgi:tetratricopeptide (TPR) repeat protein